MLGRNVTPRRTPWQVPSGTYRLRLGPLGSAWEIGCALASALRFRGRSRCPFRLREGADRCGEQPIWRHGSDSYDYEWLIELLGSISRELPLTPGSDRPSAHSVFGWILRGDTVWDGCFGATERKVV